MGLQGPAPGGLPGILNLTQRRLKRARPCHEIALASTYDPERTPIGIAVQAPPKIGQRRPLDQRTNQTQEFLLLWAAASSDEKRSDLNVGNLAT
jgi:hypothetical protein